MTSEPDLTLLLKVSAQAVRADKTAAKARFRSAAERAAPARPVPCANCGVKHRSLTAEQCEDRAMSEVDLQKRVIYRLKRDGWKFAHAGRAWVGGEGDAGHWVTPMSKGWPDLTCAKAGHRLVFLELKREQGEVEPEQLEWLALLNATGARAVVIRPSDLREGRVDAITRQGSPL